MLLLLLQQYMNTTEGSSHKSSKNYHMTQSQGTNVPINYILIMGCQEFLQLYFVDIGCQVSRQRLDESSRERLFFWMNNLNKGFDYGFKGLSTKVG